MATRADLGRTGPVIELRNVSRVYEPFPALLRFFVRTPATEPVVALDGVDLELAAGELCVVVGPNGAGKTTMFRIIAGLTTPTRGTSRVLGHDSAHESHTVRRHIGWMPAEERTLFLRQTCHENLYFHGRMHALGKAELRVRIPRMLERVGLGGMDDRVVFSLSTGMRSRLKLARALLHRPSLLILDEPTSSVDPVASAQLLDLVREVVEQDRLAAIVSSHRLEEIEALGSRMVLLDRGKVLFDGDLDALRSRLDIGRRLRLDFRSRDQATSAARRLRSAGSEVDARGTVLQVRLTDDAPLEDQVDRLHGAVVGLVSIEQRSVPLRDVLAHVYRERSAT